MQKKWLEKSEKLTNLVASVNSFESGEPIKKVEKENDQMLMSVVDDGTLFPKKLKEESIIRGTEAKK